MFNHSNHPIALYILQVGGGEQFTELCLYMNLPMYLVAQIVHGPRFTTPIKSGHSKCQKFKCQHLASRKLTPGPNLIKTNIFV